MAAIEALYIFDEHNNTILNHTYNGRPPLPSTLLPLYLQHSSPRPSVFYLPSVNPPSICYSVLQDNLLFLSPSSSDVEPLLVLEFLHRVADALAEFLGSPLIATKVTSNYDVVAQIVGEMADGGVVCQSEANVLRDTVETGPGMLNNLLGGLGLPGSSPALGPQSGIGSGLGAMQRPGMGQTPQSAQGSAIPWRRSNVRHTSNEMYVDIVETLAVIVAPSGRPLSAFANGSIAFNSKVSGVPDLLLHLNTGGKGAGMGNRGDQLRSVMERVVFHPCVRINRWKSDGVLSFVPPDGRFALCGYEVDLLGPDFPLNSSSKPSSNLDLPASLEVRTGQGSSGNEFEVRVSFSRTATPGTKSAATTSLQSNISGSSRPGAFRAGSGGDSKAPSLENLAVRVPIPSSVRNVSDLRASRGEAQWNPADSIIEWKIGAKDAGGGSAVLRCTVVGPLADEEEDTGVMNGMTATTYDYDEDQPSSSQAPQVRNGNNSPPSAGDVHRGEKNKALMPTSATLSFSVKGWLASGLKVESLLVDSKKSKGLGPEVRPYKGVKYLSVSGDGIEVRC